MCHHCLNDSELEIYIFLVPKATILRNCFFSYLIFIELPRLSMTHNRYTNQGLWKQLSGESTCFTGLYGMEGPTPGPGLSSGVGEE